MWGKSAKITTYACRVTYTFVDKGELPEGNHVLFYKSYVATWNVICSGAPAKQDATLCALWLKIDTC